MAFFSNLKEKVGSISRKSNEIMKIKKLNTNIRTEEDSLKALYRELGEYCFEKYTEGETNDSTVEELCEEVQIHLENINYFQEKIKEIKNMVLSLSKQTESDDGEDSSSE